MRFRLYGEEEIVNSPRMLVVQFRTDSEAFQGSPSERSAAIKMATDRAIDLIGGLDFDAESLASDPNISERGFLDANSEFIGTITHTNNAGRIGTPDYASKPAFVRMTFDMGLLFDKRLGYVQGNDELAWRLSCEEVRNQIREFKATCDVHPSKYFRDSLDPYNGIVGSIETCDWREPALTSYLYSEAHSVDELSSLEDYAEKPGALFVSVQKNEVSAAKALLRENPYLKSVSLPAHDFDYHSDAKIRYSAELFIPRDNANNDRLTLLVTDQFSGVEFELKLHDGNRTEWTGLPTPDALKTHFEEQASPDQDSPAP